jgi:methionine-rich copper-binding protein CopC
MKRLAALSATAFLVAAPAFAHSHLVHTVPANATVVRHTVSTIKLHFDQPVERQFARFEIRRGSRVVASGALRQTGGTEMVVRLSSPLRRGAYLVRYRIVSADGHPVTGQWSFTVRPRGQR